MQEVTAYLKDRQEKDQDFDRAFLQVLPYMQADWRGLSLNKIFQMEMEYKGWDEKKFMLVYRLAEKNENWCTNTTRNYLRWTEIAKSPLLTSQGGHQESFHYFRSRWRTTLRLSSTWVFILGCSRQTIENMYYYEYYYYVKNLSEYIKAKNKQQSEQQEQQESSMGSYRSQMSSPKMPKTPSLKTPSIKMPRL